MSVSQTEATTIPPAGPRGMPAALELLKPITWFPPMWAYGCGVVSSGQPISGRWGLVALGVLLAGTDGLRHQPGGERLVRPACRRDQRAESTDSLRPPARVGPDSI